MKGCLILKRSFAVSWTTAEADPLLPLNFTNFGWPVLLPLRPFPMQLKVIPDLRKPSSSLRHRDESLPPQSSLEFEVSHRDLGTDDVERTSG